MKSYLKACLFLSLSTFTLAARPWGMTALNVRGGGSGIQEKEVKDEKVKGPCTLILISHGKSELNV